MIDLAVTLLALPFAAGAAYLAMLGLLALAPQRRRPRPATTARAATVIVVVPAHNEESTLPQLLRSLAAQSVPPGEARVAVIADNCTDGTAAVARASGATAWERFDGENRSKGHALAWLFAQAEFWAAEFDAVAIVDADCVVNDRFIASLQRELAGGAQVLQARYDILNPERNATLALRQFAFGLMHVVRARGKRAYGGSAGLKGTGMCFTRAALRDIGWTSFGLAEDAEQHIELIRRGYVVEYVPDAIVAGDVPASLSASATQHERWEAGRLAAMRGTPSLLVAALRRRSVVFLDVAIEQVLPPLAVIAAALGTSLVASIFLELAVASRTAAVGIACVVGYVLCGVTVLRPSPGSLCKAAIVAPAYVAWKLLRYVRALMPRARTWTRTPRDGVAR